MGGDKEVAERKVEYRKRLESYLSNYKKIVIVNVDNVGSNQMQKVRIALRGKAVLLMGKNTLMRKVIRDLKESNPQFAVLLPEIVGNMGFVFTNEDLKEVRNLILSNKVPAAARSGTIAPMDCVIPPGATGLDPGQTGFFQALNIGTKIVKGSIEIMTEVHLIRKGDKVTPSHVSLLSKLNIKPFFYGFTVLKVYDAGSLFDAEVLDISNADLLAKFANAVRYLTAVSLQIGVPNATTVPHSIARGFKNLVALALVEDAISFEAAAPFKLFYSDAAAFAAKYGGGGGGAASAPAAGKAAAPAAAAPAAKKEEPKKEESDEDIGLGGGLFGDD